MTRDPTPNVATEPFGDQSKWFLAQSIPLKLRNAARRDCKEDALCGQF